MKEKNQSRGIKRRKFLQASSALAVSTMILPLGSTPLFGDPRSGSIESSIPAVTLDNGIKMPILGFGTHTLRGDTCVRCVSEAISLGYRLIDTATIYGNEQYVGAGKKKSRKNRKELLVT